MVNLRTRYLGLDLACPIVASAGPVTQHLETLERLEAAGAGAVVLPSLFEEEIVQAAASVHRVLSQGAESSPEARSYLPELPAYDTGPERYLQLVADAKDRLQIPVIASLNGSTPGGWLRYARDLADAGADAIELNVYFVAADVAHTPHEVEARYLELVAAVRGAVSVPLAVKVAPYFSAMAHTAARLVDAGADGLVLFNRFYQPDIDLETLDVLPDVSLSTSTDLRLPLRWIAILRGHVRAGLAISGGVHDPEDVVKAVLAGADVAMTTSALLRNGPEHVTTLRRGLGDWLDSREYDSVAQACGSVSRQAVPDPDVYERANYVAALRRASARFSR